MISMRVNGNGRRERREHNESLKPQTPNPASLNPKTLGIANNCQKPQTRSS